MPRYNLEVAVPGGTSESNAVRSDVRVDERFVESVIVYIDPGSSGLVNVEVQQGEQVLFPEPPSTAFSIPDVSDPAPVAKVLPGSPNTVSVRAWAPQAANEHEVFVSLDVLSLDNVADPVRLEGVGRSGPSVGRGVSPEDIMTSGEDG